ncbi:MAG: Inner membrane ABC transporter permease protein YcjO [Anaerolineae bacterium]|nr:Inner membrane ABC transporter permease protein YcjO [Anaerolineae bacterium]
MATPPTGGVLSSPQTKPGWSLLGNSLHAREVRLAWLLIAPTALIVFGLVLFPALFSIWISFRDIGLNNLNDVLNAPFVGMKNYGAVVNDFSFKYNDLANMGAAVTSIVYSVAATVLTVMVGLAAALLLNQPFRARGLSRAIFLFPYVAPIVSVAFVWRWMLDPKPSGVINYLLMEASLIDRPVAWLATRGWALVLVIIFEAWRYFPFAMLMILARLQAVDSTLYEAAKVDGANAWQRFLNITLPELRYVIGAIFLLRLIWTFNKFDDIFLLTGGGFGTKVLPVLTYEFSFRLFDFGKGAAASMILLAILVVFLILYVRFVMRNADA